MAPRDSIILNIKAANPAIKFVIFTGYASIKTAVDPLNSALPNTYLSSAMPMKF